MGSYMIMSCSKNFPDGSLRKVRVVFMADGQTIGEVSTPRIRGGTVSAATDTVAVLQTSDGIAAAYMQSGVGVLIEVVEYYDSIGFRAQINTFNTCSGGG